MPTRPPVHHTDSRSEISEPAPAGRTEGVSDHPKVSEPKSDIPHVIRPVSTAPSHGRPASRPRVQTPPPVQERPPSQFGIPDAEQHRHLEQLNEVALRLHDAAIQAREAEDRRELDFRHHEDDRDQIFLSQEEIRNREARERADNIWKELDARLAALAVVPAAAAPPPPPAEVTPPPPPATSDELPIDEGAPIPSDGSPSDDSSSDTPDDTPTPRPSSPSSSSSESIKSSRPVTVLENVSDKEEADKQSVHTLPGHLKEAFDLIRLEREEFEQERAEAAAERERRAAELAAEHQVVLSLRDDRIKALEEELEKVKADLAGEREARLTEEAAAREEDRRERIARDEAFERQLADITNLIQGQREETEQEKELAAQKAGEKDLRRMEKQNQFYDLRELVLTLSSQVEGDRQRAEQQMESCATKEDLRAVIDHLQRQNDEQKELLQMFSDSWRADCARHQEETINAVKATAQEQVPYNVEGYLNEFSKALATEVRMLLGEVGKLREDRRAIQAEIATLFFMKSKWGPGGEFEGDGPPMPAEPQQPPPPQPEEAPQEAPPVARPGWRPAGKKGKKKRERAAAQQAAPPAQQFPPSMMEQYQGSTMYAAQGRPPQAMPRPANVLSPRTQVESWHQWQPNPNYLPSSVDDSQSEHQTVHHVPPQVRQGPFGPVSEDDVDDMYARM